MNTILSLKLAHTLRYSAQPPKFSRQPTGSSRSRWWPRCADRNDRARRLQPGVENSSCCCRPDADGPGGTARGRCRDRRLHSAKSLGQPNAWSVIFRSNHELSSVASRNCSEGDEVMLLLVATDREVVVVDVERGAGAPAHGISGRPTCLTADPLVHGRAWCGTHRDGVFRSDDGGRSWQSVGLAGRLIMAVTASPADRDVVWVGTEPSEVWRSRDAGNTWEQTSKLETLPSSSEWSFPPRPDTHHVRWIACHPIEPDRLWVAIEAGALVSTIDGGRTWSDRVPGGPWDTHELAINPKAPDTLRVSAGDGYSRVTMPVPRGARRPTASRSAICAVWRSIAEQPEVVVVSASSGPTPCTWLAARMAGCIAVSLESVGSASATAGRNQPAPSRLCSAPARKAESCGPRMSAACTVRMMAGRVGAARSAMPRPHSIYAASRWCSRRRLARSRCEKRRQDQRSKSGRGGGIRTPDPLVPNQMRYQAALRPDGNDYLT